MNDFIDRFNSVPLTHKLLGLFVIMVGLFVAFLMGVHGPKSDEISQLERELSGLQQRESQLDDAPERHAEMEAELQSLQQDLQLAREKLPESAEISDLLQRIYNHAQTAGLTINRFRRNEEIPKEDVIEIPVEMELVGTFDEVANFFYFVGRIARIVNIRDITLRRAGSGVEPDGELIVTAQATTFRWNPAAGGGVEE